MFKSPTTALKNNTEKLRQDSEPIIKCIQDAIETYDGSNLTAYFNYTDKIKTDNVSTMMRLVIVPELAKVGWNCTYKSEENKLRILLSLPVSSSSYYDR